MWKGYAATQTLLQVKDKGRQGGVMAELRKQMRSPEDRAMLEMIHTDRVYTHKSTCEGGCAHECPRCGGAQADDGGDYIDRCTQTRRFKQVKEVPRCLRYTGHAPVGWIPADRSVQMTTGEV